MEERGELTVGFRVPPKKWASVVAPLQEAGFWHKAVLVEGESDVSGVDVVVYKPLLLGLDAGWIADGKVYYRPTADAVRQFLDRDAAVRLFEAVVADVEVPGVTLFVPRHEVLGTREVASGAAAGVVGGLLPAVVKPCTQGADLHYVVLCYNAADVAAAAAQWADRSEKTFVQAAIAHTGLLKVNVAGRAVQVEGKASIVVCDDGSGGDSGARAAVDALTDLRLPAPRCAPAGVVTAVESVARRLQGATGAPFFNFDVLLTAPRGAGGCGDVGVAVVDMNYFPSYGSWLRVGGAVPVGAAFADALTDIVARRGGEGGAGAVAAAGGQPEGR